MDCGKIGKLIQSLRKEKNLTQKMLANAMNLSDRTISKWERGIGCPDISLLNELSEIFGVNIEKILAGDLYPNESHYISFVALVGYDRVLLVKLYPEQNAELRFPKMRGNEIYAFCIKHGLWKMDVGLRKLKV